MTNEELKAAIDHVQKIDDAIRTSDVTDVYRMSVPADEKNDSDFMVCMVLEAARELLQLKDGMHPDMVMVQREQWQPIETYDYQNFPEVWLAAWIEPSEYAKENGVSSRWDIGIGRCWHVNTRKFTGVLGGTPTYWCKTNKPYSPAQKGNV